MKKCIIDIPYFKRRVIIKGTLSKEQVEEILKFNQRIMLSLPRRSALILNKEINDTTTQR